MRDYFRSLIIDMPVTAAAGAEISIIAVPPCHIDQQCLSSIIPGQPIRCFYSRYQYVHTSYIAVFVLGVFRKASAPQPAAAATTTPTLTTTTTQLQLHYSYRASTSPLLPPFQE